MTCEKIGMLRNRKFSNLLETIDTTSQSVTTFSTGYDVGRVNYELSWLSQPVILQKTDKILHVQTFEFIGLIGDG